ncbi:MAG TPA: hypothetical protein VKV04_15480 [Verrucomicrobiae bacterium]|nr:hypothetical protein [Verrucomicrobiae bacterium]
MSKLAPETRAILQTICVALIAFVIGFLGMLALFEWLILRFVAPDGHWFEILHVSMNALLISVLVGGLGSATLSVRVLSWYYNKWGVRRCHFCGNLLKGARAVCTCPQAQALRK